MQIPKLPKIPAIPSTVSSTEVTIIGRPKMIKNAASAQAAKNNQ